MTSTTTPIVAVDEYAAAAAHNVSVHWLRKDRSGAQLVPFTKLGKRVVYDLDRCRLALAAREQGGKP